jgi:hypothetical protein
VEQLKKWAEEKFATKEDLKQFATKEDLKRFATKEDIKRLEDKMATKEDLKRIEDKMATKEQFEAIAVSVEESGRDMVQYLLEQRGYKCTAERLRLDADYELDIYCNAGVLTAVGEAKVRAGRRDVEKDVRESAGAVAQTARQNLRKTRPGVLHPRRRAFGSAEGKGAQGVAHRKQKRSRHAGGGPWADVELNSLAPALRVSRRWL